MRLVDLLRNGKLVALTFSFHTLLDIPHFIGPVIPSGHLYKQPGN